MTEAATRRPKAAKPREFAGGGRMSEHEALMWNIEKDPWLNPSGAALALLDRPIDFDCFERHIRHGVARIPRLQQRVVPGFGRLSTPAWVPDPEFDLTYHLRRITLPGAATTRQLLELSAQLYREPLDRTRPLWRFVVIDGMADGRGALWSMFHHSISDGMGQLRMAEIYHQLGRDDPPPPEVDIEALIQEAVAEHRSKEQGGDLGNDLASTARSTANHLIRRNVGITRRVLGELSMIPADPSRVPDAISTAGASAWATVAQFGSAASDVLGGSPLWANRSRHRHLEHVQVSLEGLKAKAKDLDGSINDLFLVGVTEAAVRYHAARDISVDRFNTSFVVSTRTDAMAGGNSFTPVPIHLSGAEMSFAQRMAEVRSVTEAAKEQARQSGGVTSLAAVANLLPTSVVTRAARAQAANMDFVTSNLRGAPFELYCAGARVEASVPMGPLAGTPVNITALSYNGKFDIGLFIDPEAIAEPAAFRDDVENAFADLLS